MEQLRDEGHTYEKNKWVGCWIVTQFLSVMEVSKFLFFMYFTLQNDYTVATLRKFPEPDAQLRVSAMVQIYSEKKKF